MPEMRCLVLEFIQMIGSLKALKMIIKIMLLSALVFYLSHSVEAIAQPLNNLAHDAGEIYMCRTPQQAREQHINPDYLVPGCQIYRPSASAPNLRPKKQAPRRG